MNGLELDLFKGEQAKAAGTALVSEHDPDWKDSAQAIVLGLPPGTFTSDDIRLACKAAGLPDPKHHNAWGALLSSLAKAGAIERVGFCKSEIPSTHARIIGLWQKKGK